MKSDNYFSSCYSSMCSCLTGPVGDMSINSRLSLKSLKSVESLQSNFIITNIENEIEENTKPSPQPEEENVAISPKKSFETFAKLTKIAKNIPFQISVYNCPGKMRKNQDRVLICSKPLIFGVFDGHVTERAAQFCQQNFSKIFLKCAKAMEDPVCKLLEFETYSLPQFSNHNQVRDLLLKTFDDTNETIRKKQILGGTTGTVLVCYKLNTSDNIFQLCANVGDSMAVKFVSSKKLKPLVLTHDHRATATKEVERVESVEADAIFGGKLYGSIAITRAFGDFDWEPCLICVPEFSEPIEVSSSPETEEFVVIGSDGIWDFLKIETMNKMLKNKKYKKDRLAYEFANKASKHGSLDDLSCIVVSLSSFSPIEVLLW
eukprot:snap_masked-scaffold_31-processed-gene-2.37-mRNA-1 protein AED:1.00 eAED:1.00 QI:0/0/0/0/1/1/2/0/374